MRTRVCVRHQGSLPYIIQSAVRTAEPTLTESRGCLHLLSSQWLFKMRDVEMKAIDKSGCSASACWWNNQMSLTLLPLKMTPTITFLCVMWQGGETNRKQGKSNRLRAQERKESWHFQANTHMGSLIRSSLCDKKVFTQFFSGKKQEWNMCISFLDNDKSKFELPYSQPLRELFHAV